MNGKFEMCSVEVGGGISKRATFKCVANRLQRYIEVGCKKMC
jgi:hypothetical protein